MKSLAIVEDEERKSSIESTTPHFAKVYNKSWSKHGYVNCKVFFWFLFKLKGTTIALPKTYHNTFFINCPPYSYHIESFFVPALPIFTPIIFETICIWHIICRLISPNWTELGIVVPRNIVIKVCTLLRYGIYKMSTR